MNRYIKWDMHRVAGYLATLDAQVFVALMSTQTAAGTKGALVEIGVHHGRSYFLMAMCRQDQERSLAIDLFEDDDMYCDSEEIGRLGHFRRNGERLGLNPSDDSMMVGSSLKFGPDEILGRAGPARFFSIDGGHRYEHVENDLSLAQETVVDEGIIVVDDFANPVWPEVTFATYDWLKGKGSDYAPFAATQAKLYLCKRPESGRYRDALAKRSELIPMARHEASFFEDRASFLRPSLPSRTRDALLRKILGTNRSAPKAALRASKLRGKPRLR